MNDRKRIIKKLVVHNENTKQFQFRNFVKASILKAQFTYLYSSGDLLPFGAYSCHFRIESDALQLQDLWLRFYHLALYSLQQMKFSFIVCIFSIRSIDLYIKADLAFIKVLLA